jgi:hypothetical protein
MGRDRPPGGGLAQRRLTHTDALRRLGCAQEAICKWRLRNLLPYDRAYFLEDHSAHLGIGKDASDHDVRHTDQGIVELAQIGAWKILC